jgi:hypothetical protein
MSNGIFCLTYLWKYFGEIVHILTIDHLRIEKPPDFSDGFFWKQPDPVIDE